MSAFKEDNGLEKDIGAWVPGNRGLLVSLPCQIDTLWGKKSWLWAEAGDLFPQGPWETEEEKLLSESQTKFCSA